MAQQPCREPIEFAAGDTLTFTRSISDYLASAGWALTYELRGGSQPIEFASIADGDSHKVTVTAAVTATWLPGDYVLAGYAIKGAERHQIYVGDFPVSADFQSSPGDEPVTTFAQRMVEKLELVMEGKADNDLLESRIGETMFKYLSPAELRTEHGYWVSVRRQEIAKERAKSGLPTGNKIRPMFRVATPGAGVGMFGRGSGYGGW